MTSSRETMLPAMRDRIEVSRAPLAEVLPLRALYRKEMNCQIVHDSLHERGFTHMYLMRMDGHLAGYGALLGFGSDPKDIVREFFVLPDHRAMAHWLFDALIGASGARAIQAQTNDPLLTLMLLDRAVSMDRQKVLFTDGMTTKLAAPGATFRATTPRDREQRPDGAGNEMGDWLLEVDGRVVAHGGVLDHYNPPYGDVFMEVAAPFRRRGYGSYLVQELKRVCYEAGNVPAARCDVGNAASRATLEKAGMVPCAYLLKGELQS